MSMLTAQANHLREMAYTVERVKNDAIGKLSLSGSIALATAAMDMRDAADTIAQLRNTCHDLQHENAKLQESYDNLRNATWDRANARAIDFMEEDELRGLCADLYDRVDELKALAQRLYYCGQRDRECDRCGMNGADMHVKMSDVDYCDGINMCIRDLGVEVDDD